MKYLDLDCLINLHKNNFGNIELLASIWFIFNWPPYGETLREAVFFQPPLFFPCRTTIPTALISNLWSQPMPWLLLVPGPDRYGNWVIFSLHICINSNWVVQAFSACILPVQWCNLFYAQWRTFLEAEGILHWHVLLPELKFKWRDTIMY